MIKRIWFLFCTNQIIFQFPAVYFYIFTYTGAACFCSIYVSLKMDNLLLTGEKCKKYRQQRKNHLQRLLRREVKVYIIWLLFYLIMCFKSFSNFIFMRILQFLFPFYIQHLEKWLSITICFLHRFRHSFHVSFLMDVTAQTCIKSARIVMVFNKSKAQDSISSSNFSSGLLTVLKLPTHQKVCIPSQVRQHC